MKKILVIGVVGTIFMAMAGGGTWAYFSDVETSGNNVFAAGTLDLGLSNVSDPNSTGSTTGTFSQSNWAPGDNHTGSLWINNAGSIAMGSVNLTLSYDMVDTSGRPTTISGSPWTNDPYDYFDKQIKITAATWDGANVTGLINQSLYSINGTAITLAGGLGAHTQKELALTFTFLSDATNGCQNNSLDLLATIIGTQ